MALVDQTADHIAAEGGALEPQRQNNFAIEIPLGDDKDVITLALEMFKLPKMGNDKIELHYQNGVVYIAGKAKTDSGSLTVKDFVDKDALGAILRWRKKVYNVKNGAVGLAKDYKYTCSLVLMSPDGSAILSRVCRISGVWPVEDPDYPEMDMKNTTGFVTLTVPLSADKVDWSGSIPGLD